MSEDVKNSDAKEIVEKRVKPTVIRRRAKVVPPAEIPEAKPEENAQVEQVEPPVDKAVAKSDTNVVEREKTKEEVLPGVKAEAKKEAADRPIVEEKPVLEKEKDLKAKVEKKEEPVGVKEPERKKGHVEKKKEVNGQVAVEPASPTKPGKDRKKVSIDIERDEKAIKKKAFKDSKKREVVTKQALLEGRESFYGPRGKRRKAKKEGSKKTEITTPKAIKRIIKVSEFITVGELAKRMGIKSSEIIRKLIALGTMATVNQSLDADTATLVASEFDYEVENVALEMDLILEEREIKEDDLKLRPPVVTIMGHVDHGKTTLLDAIRQTDVTAGESGGITQHIGAYDVKLENGDVVFLDTPGHEAFTSMRARGAKVTDLVVLVVAADDGVKPQTEEAIDHAKAAEVPIIVAINKIDKPDANPERVKQELSKFELIPEDWGGSTIFANVSAKERMGLKELLELILLQAEVMELKAAPDMPARGTIIEAKLDKGRGPVATVLVQSGTLRVGDNFVSGVQSGKVRGLHNDRGQKVKDAGPSIPVEVIGLSGVPDAGDDFVVLAEERLARQMSIHRQEKLRDSELAKMGKVTLDALFDRIQQGEFHELNIVLKADVHGSNEAITESLHKLSTDKVKLKVIHSGVGGITESDVLLASASNAIIIGFHVRPEIKATALAEAEKIDIRTYSIIYDVVSDVRSAMEGMLSPVVKEVYLGRAEIRETYSISKIGTIAGCYVIDGKIVRNANVRVLRDNVVVYEGKLSSLKRFKDDVKEAVSGYECGMGVENFNDIKVGDVIEAYTHEEEAAKL